MKIRPRLSQLTSATFRSLIAASRAFGAEKNMRGRVRPSSFPFVSGDTFRSIANVVFDISTMRSIDSKKIQVPAAPHEPSIIFIEYNVLDVDTWREDVLQWMDHSLAYAPGHVVIATNGDRAPRDFLETLSGWGNSVFAQNALDDFRGVTPIPIGLQNVSHMKSGVLDDFLLYQDAIRQGRKDNLRRDNLVYASFNVSNQPDDRGHLTKLLENSPYELSGRRVRPREFRRNLLSSRFVLSPPGAGPDCHRTWEALLLGAVPVILRSTLAESLYKDSRIHVVDCWEEFLLADPAQLMSIWELSMTRGIEKAFFDYWYVKVLSSLQKLSST